MEIELLELDSLKSSLSIPDSVRSQTKSKFDALLKSALKKTPTENTEFNKSSEKLINDEDEVQGEDNEGFKVPIPRPRRIKNSHALSMESCGSDGTYKVASPKVVKEFMQKVRVDRKDKFLLYYCSKYRGVTFIWNS